MDAWPTHRARRYLRCAAHAAARRGGVDTLALDRLAALSDSTSAWSELDFRAALAAAGWPDFLRDRAVAVVRRPGRLRAATSRVHAALGTSGIAALAVVGYAAARVAFGAAVVHAGLVFAATVWVALRIYRSGR